VAAGLQSPVCFNSQPPMHLVYLPVFACLWLLCASNHPAQASVVMTGTRVIYPAALPGKTLQLSNPDAHPYLVQVWLDAGDENSEPGAADNGAPFIANPPIFRMEPGSGQAVRLMPTDTSTLPTDRESLFYLNFSQIPALAPEALEGNALLMVMKSRFKLFYRPRGLSPAAPDTRKLACALRFKVDAGQLQVDNPSAFHAVVSQAETVLNGRNVPLLQAQVFAPFSTRHLPLAEGVTLVEGAQVQVSVLNDYGADSIYTCPLH